jgi:hypothetical protein
MFDTLLVKLGLKRDVGAPVHVGTSPVYFTAVYEHSDVSIFSWRTADHCCGNVQEFALLCDAQIAREMWEAKMEITQHATFVHEDK